MLDRGQGEDWFASSEIIIECVVAVLFLYLFVAHMLTSRNPFIEPALFKDRNLVTGLIFIFIVGIILLATLALLPPFLQNLMGFPVITTGEILAPRGIGSMCAMLMVGRLINRVDVRWLVGLGLSLTAYSLFEMAAFNLFISPMDVVRTGIIQGLGLGFVFVPLSTVTFSTLAPQLRTEATAMFSLMRNIGSSIGISVMVTLAARATQTNHAVLGESLTMFRAPVKEEFIRIAIENGPGMAIAQMNQQLTQQAAAIGYLNDFKAMAWMALCSLPLLLLFRTESSTRAPVAQPSQAAADKAKS